MDFGVKRPSDALVEVSAKRSRHDDQLQLINHYSNDDNRQLMETDTDVSEL